MATDRASPEEFLRLAKDAGDKLRTYVLTYASGATAVFFFTLTGKDLNASSAPEKALLAVALFLFGLTTVLCLYELHVDARRFFNLAKQLEAEEGARWAENERYRKLRLRLIYSSYLGAALATAAVVGFLILRL